MPATPSSWMSTNTSTWCWRTSCGACAELQPEQVAQLHEEGIAGACQPAEAERVFIQHVAAIAREHDGSRDRLIADQGIDVEEIRGGGRRPRHAARPREQNRCVGPRVVAQRSGLLLNVLADELDEDGPTVLLISVGAGHATDIHETPVR